MYVDRTVQMSCESVWATALHAGQARADQFSQEQRHHLLCQSRNVVLINVDVNVTCCEVIFIDLLVFHVNPMEKLREPHCLLDVRKTSSRKRQQSYSSVLQSTLRSCPMHSSTRCSLRVLFEVNCSESDVQFRRTLTNLLDVGVP